jgi:hypothetical protein
MMALYSAFQLVLLTERVPVCGAYKSCERFGEDGPNVEQLVDESTARRR